MDFTLNEEQKMLVDTIKTMGQREKFKELARHIDETGEFPYDLLKKYASLGLLGMTISAEHGGGAQPAMNAILCIEELAKFSPHDSGAGVRIERGAGQGNRHLWH